MIIFRFGFRRLQDKYGQLLLDTEAARARIESGESELEEVVTPDGTSLRISKTPDGSVQYSSVGGEVTIVGQRFPAADKRPLTYPADAPFLPNVQLSITEIPKNRWRSISWHRVSDARRLAGEIARQLRDAGWKDGRTRRPLFGLLGVEKEFKKGEVIERLVLHRLPGGREKLQLIRRSKGGHGPDAS